MDWSGYLYLISAIFFIFALKGLSHPETARRGNAFGMMGMAIAIVTTLLGENILSFSEIVIAIAIGALIGTIIAHKIIMTALPQLVAAFHSLVGLAAVFVAAAAFYSPESYNIGSVGKIHLASLIEMSLGVSIGAVTFTGSVIAFGKLQALLPSKPLIFTGQHFLNTLLAIGLIILIVLFCQTQSITLFWAIVILSFIIGVMLIVPIGGADMPVVVSMLNSYSGWAAAGIGFTLANTALIITGALVGASGAILSYIMCRGMNRSFINVILGGIGKTNASVSSITADRPIKSGAGEDAAFLMKNAEKIIIVPGYGMAVAQAQHALREMVDLLREEGVSVKYAIHPVAGRMPGHMNVLLAEANVSYDDVFEMEDINREFANTDIAFVIGANDVVNPAAKNDTNSSIYGMPILNVDEAEQVLFVKRSMASGYAGIENELFFQDKTTMLFGDAKTMCESIIKALNN